MLSEFRVYVVNGEIRNICHYLGTKPGQPGYIELDTDIVKEAVKIFCESDEGKHIAGFGMDFAVINKSNGVFATSLVEVNEGFSLGRYEGLSGKDYTDLLIARWGSLMRNKK